MSSQSQLLGPFPGEGDLHGQERPCVALTFDDGPNEPYTSALAELLARRAVLATFFQVGQAVDRFPQTTAALVAAGHVVGHHSYTHHMHRCFTGIQLCA
ncbi:MAG: polysaccharide deacetylase family protein [Actinomycetota bacterium]|nr:polysaccharide deacetylase family protein [Actinomycetota bacterium]